MHRLLLVALASMPGVLVAQEPPPPLPLREPAAMSGLLTRRDEPAPSVTTPAQGGPRASSTTVTPTTVTPAQATALLPGCPPETVTVVSECDPILNPAPKRFEFLPPSLLWEPLLAVKRDPRTGFTFSDANSRFSNDTADPSIGTTFGIARFHREESPVWWQFDMFAVVHSRFSAGDYLINTDYRAGALSTARLGNWAMKFGWEHTSTHIGDETLVYQGGRFIGYERDEAVVGLSHLFEEQLRVYGVAAWSFWRRIEGPDGTRPSPYRFDVGFDWYKRASTTRRGQPFAALNVGFDGATKYDANLVAQVGWMWKVADRRLGQFRVYAEFADTRSPFGQTYLDRERYAGAGFALDY